MSIHEDLNFRGPHADAAPQRDVRIADATAEQLREMVDQTRSILFRTQRRIERNQQKYESLERHVWMLWMLVVVAVVGCGGLAWYEVSGLAGQRAVPNLPISRTIPADAVPEVSAVKPEPVPEVPKLNPVPADKPTDTPALAQANLPRASEVLWDKVMRQRIEFQLENNQTVQVAPGIYLTIKHADAAHQQVNGWLQISKDGRIVFIREQEAKKSLSFVSPSDEHPSYVVFTKVESGGVSGYLLLPSHS